MYSGSITTNISSQAADLLELINQFHGHLDASMNPERLALRALQLDARTGWTKIPYSDEAFDVWYKALKKNPDSFLTTHHLAIMHHARAIDRENSEKSFEADDDWAKSIRFWHQIYENDAFWEHLVVQACKGTKRDAVDQLRESFPQKLLQIHFDIAMHEDTRDNRKARSKYHINLALNSPFTDKAKDAVRCNAYNRFILSVPHNVWDPDEINPDVIRLGTDCIIEYLKYDPGCIPAIEDAIRLQIKLLRARYTELQAEDGESPKRDELFNKIVNEANNWKDYFDQLISVKHLDDDIRNKLGLWYRVMGDVFSSLDQKVIAVESYYEKGAIVCFEDDTEGRRCRKKLGEKRALIALDRACKNEDGTRDYCEFVRAYKDLSVRAHAYLANAYSLLREFDVAEDLCKKAMLMESEIIDYEAMIQNENDQKFVKTILDSIADERRRAQILTFREKGKSLLDDRKYERAIEMLNKALELDNSEMICYFLRAQAFLELKKLPEAENDIRVSRNIAEKSSDSNWLLEPISDFEKHIHSIKEIGGVEASDFRQQAIEAFNAGNNSEAEDWLREAIEISKNNGHPKGTPQLRKDLSKVLVPIAVKIANDAQTEPSRLPILTSDYFPRGLRPSSVQSEFKKAAKILKEAMELDPDNEQASTNYNIVQGIISRLNIK